MEKNLNLEHWKTQINGFRAELQTQKDKKLRNIMETQMINE